MGLIRTVSIVGLVFVLCFVLVTFSEVKIANAEPNTIVVPDDYSSIQEALSVASDGDTVYVKSGTYSGNLVLNKSISLLGENKETTIIHCRDNTHPTILVTANGVTVTGFTVKNNLVSPSRTLGGLAAVHVLHADYCNVYENIMIDSGYGVWLYGSHSNNISDNTITKANHGIMVQLSSGNNLFRNAVSDCWTGIWINYSSENTLKNNEMTNNSRNFALSGDELVHYYNDIDTTNRVNGKTVYHLSNQKNTQITSSIFPDLGFLVLVNCTDLVVQGLSITNSYCGLLVFDCSNLTVTNNTLTNTTTAIMVQSSSGVTVTENLVNFATDDGICLEHSENISITKNRIEHVDVNGIYLEISNNNKIAENLMTENFNYGIHLEYSSDNIITSNKLTNSIWGIGLRHSPNNQIGYNNLTCHNFKNPVSLMHGLQSITLALSSDNCTIFGNTITNNSEYGISLSSSSNIDVYGNNITDNNSGIQLEGSCNNNITANAISKSSEFAIYLSNSNNSIFYNNNFINNHQQIEDHYWHVTHWGGPSINIWNNATIGNYWSNYNGADSNDDGIGDTPYIIDENNQDNKPVIEPVEFVLIPEFSSVRPLLVLLIASAIVCLFFYIRKNSPN